MEKTLVIVKPDAVQRGLIGSIVSRLEARGLKITAMKMIQMDRALAERHYGVHMGKAFFEGLVNYIVSCPVVVAVFEGKNAVQVVRNTMGATDPTNAPPGTVRGDWALEIGRNLIHGSDSMENAQKEIALFFREGEVFSYKRCTDPWISEQEEWL